MIAKKFLLCSALARRLASPSCSRFSSFLRASGAERLCASLDFYFAGQLEDFRVMNKLGQGQYGIVKLGVHVKTGERVALKIINKADLTEAERSPFPLMAPC